MTFWNFFPQSSYNGAPRLNIVKDLISKTSNDRFSSQNDSHVDQWNKKTGLWMGCLENTAWLFHGCKSMSKLVKWSTLNMGSLVCLNYTSVKSRKHRSPPSMR